MADIRGRRGGGCLTTTSEPLRSPRATEVRPWRHGGATCNRNRAFRTCARAGPLRALRKVDDRLNRVLETWRFRASWIGFLVIAAGVFATIQNRLVGYRPAVWLASAAALMTLCVFVGRRGGLPAPRRLSRNAGRILTWAPVLGVCLRILFPLIVPPAQVSDSSEYLSLARGILEKGTYEWTMPNGNHWYAYRPPGMAFVLAVFIKIFGETVWLPAAINILAYVAASAVLRRMSIQWMGPVAGSVTQILFALWPSGIAATGLVQYEPLFLALLSWSIWLFLTAANTTSHFAAGLVTGLSILVRQALLPVPALWLLRRPSPAIAASVAGLGLVVGAWAVRNHGHGVPVTVSSNTGSLLYQVANDRAAAGYDDSMVSEMFAKLDYDEYRQHVEMGNMAKQWILAQPARWLELMMQRLPNFLGEDTAGLYFAMRVARSYDGPAYSIPQLFAHAWWVLVWVLATVAVIARRDTIRASADVQFLLLLVLMFVGTALPFLMQARYHTSLIPIVLLLAGWAIHSGQSRAAS